MINGIPLELDPGSDGLLAIECAVGPSQGAPLDEGDGRAPLLDDGRRGGEQRESDGDQSSLGEHSDYC